MMDQHDPEEARQGEAEVDSLDSLTLQCHLNVLTKFTHVESRLSGRKRQGK